jgi:hypothetical protein
MRVRRLTLRTILSLTMRAHDTAEVIEVIRRYLVRHHGFTPGEPVGVRWDPTSQAIAFSQDDTTPRKDYY